MRFIFGSSTPQMTLYKQMYNNRMSVKNFVTAMTNGKLHVIWYSPLNLTIIAQDTKVF